MKKLTSLHLTPTPKTLQNILVSVNIPLGPHSFVFIANKNINIIFNNIKIILKFYCKMEYCKTEGFRLQKHDDIVYIASFTCRSIVVSFNLIMVDI
jgi:hypothetical protein